MPVLEKPPIHFTEEIAINNKPMEEDILDADFKDALKNFEKKILNGEIETYSSLKEAMKHV